MKPAAILREFHNRMFVDFSTSSKYGEIKNEINDKRKKQISVINEMGFDVPYHERLGKKIIVDDEFAIIIVPVKFE